MRRRVFIRIRVSRTPMNFSPLPTHILYFLVVVLLAQILYPVDLAPVSIKLGKKKKRRCNFVSFIHWRYNYTRRRNSIHQTVHPPSKLHWPHPCTDPDKPLKEFPPIFELFFHNPVFLHSINLLVKIILPALMSLPRLAALIPEPERMVKRRWRTIVSRVAVDRGRWLPMAEVINPVQQSCRLFSVVRHWWNANRFGGVEQSHFVIVIKW